MTSERKSILSLSWMSYRMPFPDPLLPLSLVGLFVCWVTIEVVNLSSPVSSAIEETHTRFAMAQMADHINGMDRRPFPTTKAELLAVLQASPIDWNSCRVNDDGIWDGWEQPMSAVFDESTGVWRFRSSGADGRFAPEDDIEVVNTQGLGPQG